MGAKVAPTLWKSLPLFLTQLPAPCLLYYNGFKRHSNINKSPKRTPKIPLSLLGSSLCQKAYEEEDAVVQFGVYISVVALTRKATVAVLGTTMSEHFIKLCEKLVRQKEPCREALMGCASGLYLQRRELSEPHCSTPLVLLLPLSRRACPRELSLNNPSFSPSHRTDTPRWCQACCVQGLSGISTIRANTSLMSLCYNTIYSLFFLSQIKVQNLLCSYWLRVFFFYCFLL